MYIYIHIYIYIYIYVSVYFKHTAVSPYLVSATFLGGGGWGIRTSFMLHTCQKHWYLQRFRLFVQHTAQGCGRGKSVTSVQPFATMPQKPSKS